MAHYRDLEINGENWRYNIGTSVVEIRYPDDRKPKIITTKDKVLGYTEQDHANADADQGLDMAVIPSALVAFIKTQA